MVEQYYEREGEREREREREREITTYLVNWRKIRKTIPTTALSHLHCTIEDQMSLSSFEYQCLFLDLDRFLF